MLKQLILVFICITVLTSCKNDNKPQAETANEVSKSYNQNDGLITMSGDFIYVADAAVLQTKKEIYSVVINDMMQQLNNKVKPFKNDAFDMVPVTVRVKKTPKPSEEEGWPFNVEIIEIIKVSAPDPNKKDTIKLEN